MTSAPRGEGDPTPTGRDGVAGLAGAVLVCLVVLDVAGVDPAPVSRAILALAGFLTVRWFLSRSPAGTAVGHTTRFTLVTLVTVVGLTTVASFALLPWTRWPQTRLDAAASLVLVQNWRLILGEPAADPDDPITGPFQHFGLVAVVAQLASATLLLLAVGRAISRRRRSHDTVVAAVTLALVVAASVVRALTDTDQPTASLDTTTRAWEFALGGLLAVAVAAFPSRGTSVVRLLDGVLPLWVATIGVALYLWHWPVVSLYLVARDRPSLGLRGAAAVMAVSLVLAIGTHLVLGRSRRRLSGRRGTLALVSGAVAVVAVVALWFTADTVRPGWFAPVADVDHPGAVAALAGHRDHARADDPVVPGPAARPTDWAGPGNQCRQSDLDPQLRICATPEPAPRRTVVVVGDSHVQQLITAVEPSVAEQRGRVVTMLRGACPFSLTSDTVPGDQGCTTWNQAALREIVAMRPDLVVTLASHDVRSGLTERTPPGFVAAWSALDREGIRVLAIRDNPRLPFNPVTCFDAHPSDPSRCSAPRSTLLSAQPPWERAGPIPDNVTFVDPSDWYCSAVQCPPEVGNVLVYLDANHPSARFTGTMAPMIGRSLLGALNGSARGY